MLLGAALALLPPNRTAAPPSSAIVVATRDLPPGAVLSAADVGVRGVPPGLVPSGALVRAGDATGQSLAAAVRAGEPLTDVRLLGPAETRLTSGDSDAVAVAVRLADPAVAELLHPGSRVDVVTAGDGQAAAGVLATDATVLMVRAGPSGTGDQGRLVVLAVRRDAATGVAAAGLHDPVAVTLR